MIRPLAGIRFWDAGAIAVAALAFVACGDGPSDPEPTATASSASATTPTVADTVPVAEFANQICEAWLPYIEETQKIENVYVGIDPNDAKALKAALLGQLRKNEAASGVLIAAAANLPRPDIEGGAEIRQAYLEEFTAQQRRAKFVIAEVEKVSDVSLDTLSMGLEAIPLEENDLESRLHTLSEKYPGAQATIDTIDARPDDCALIFLA